MRDRLVSIGLPPDQIEVVGTGRVAQSDAVRILAVQSDVPAEQALAPAPVNAQSDEPLGQAYFLSKVPLTIEKGESALVSVFNAEIEAKPVYYYDPISNRGSTKFAFRAVLVENPASARSTLGRSRSTRTSSFWARG